MMVAIAVLQVGISAMATNAAAADYDPIPAGWNIKIDLPGRLKVGARYCTQDGKCQTVGGDIVGFKTSSGLPVYAPQTCQMYPRHPICAQASMSVQVLAANGNNAVIVRLNDRNYATTGDSVLVQTAAGEVPATNFAQTSRGRATPLMSDSKLAARAFSVCLDLAASTSTTYSSTDGGKSAIRMYEPCRVQWDAYVDACKVAGGTEGSCNLQAGSMAQAALLLHGR